MYMGINMKNTDVYWLCGGSCSGKSTITKMLAANHGFCRYDGDGRAVHPFLSEGRLDHISDLKRLREGIKSASLRWFYEMSSHDLAEMHIAWSGACATMIADELEQETGNKPVIVDMMFGFPSSVLPVASSNRVEFIFASQEFQTRMMRSRSGFRSRLELFFETDDEVQAAYDRWIGCLRLLTEIGIEDCEKHKVPYKITGGVASLQESYEYVASSFGLSPVVPAVMPAEDMG